MKKHDYFSELYDIIQLHKKGAISDYEAAACSFAIGALHQAQEIDNRGDISAILDSGPKLN